MLFDISPDTKRDFANFITGTQQQEARQAAERAATQRVSAYLWGKSGTGKSHLLTAAGNLARESGLKVCDFGSMTDDADLVLVDDIGRAPAAEQDELFSLLKNCIQNGTPTVLAAGRSAATQVKLDAAVRSRLEALPSFRLFALGDNEMCSALVHHANSFGRELDKEVANLLVQTQKRNLGYLMRMLVELDKEAIASKDQLSAAFARRWLRRSGMLR